MTKPVPLSSQVFVRRLTDRVHAGESFIPLIGSGMSAPSGILMGQQFTNFLAYTMYLVLRNPSREARGRTGRLDVRTDGWPRYPTAEDREVVQQWCLKEFKRICEEYGFEVVDDGERVTDVVPLKNVSIRTAGPQQLLLALSCPWVPQLLKSPAWEESEDVTRRLSELLGRNLPESSSGGEGAEFGFFAATSQHDIIEAGIRSMHDWRATLKFLSRVIVERDELRLGAEDMSVIDSFNVHITRDRQHNLGHKMLAHLSRPMRFRTILTTNFDKLLESAYNQIKLPLAVLPVSIKGSLPDPKTVFSQDCIVKLHGELLETRADFSLNDEPTPEDKRRFARCFSPADDEIRHHSQRRRRRACSHLLVLGYSGSDRRCVQMIKHLLDVNKTTTVFWICFDKWDVKNVEQLFLGDASDHRDRFMLHQTRRPDLLLYELYQNLTLCLPGGGFAYEFSHRVPPERPGTVLRNRDGAIVDQLVAKLDDEDLLGEAVRDCEGHAEKEISAKQHGREAVAKRLGAEVADCVLHSNPRPVLPSGLQKFASLEARRSADGSGYRLTLDLASGAANALNFAFNKLRSEGYECVWFELQDFSDAYTLVRDMLQVVALRLGRFQLEHVCLLPGGLPPASADNEGAEGDPAWETVFHHVRRLVSYFNVVPGRWVYVLYARNVPGACSGWNNAAWPAEEYALFHKMLAVLERVGFQIVYAPLTESRCRRDVEKQAFVERELLGELNMILRRDSSPAPPPEVPSANPQELGEASVEFERLRTAGALQADSQFPILDAADPIAGDAGAGKFSHQLSLYRDILRRVVEKWIRPGSDSTDESARQLNRRRVRFLFAITLFRQSRHTSAFFSDAVYSCPFRFNEWGIDNDWLRASEVRQWIDELRELRIFYHKPGGYSWKHRDIRLGIQHLLQNAFYEGDNLVPYNFLLENRARSHFWIGDWYVKAFMTSGHATPVVESLYHRFQCAHYAQFAKPSGLTYGADGGQIRAYREQLFRSAVMELLKTLVLSDKWLKFWLSSASPPEMFRRREDLRMLRVSAEKIDSANREDMQDLTRQVSARLEHLEHSLRGEAGAFPGKKWMLPWSLGDYHQPPAAAQHPAVAKVRDVTFDPVHVGSVVPDVWLDASRFRDWVREREIDELLRALSIYEATDGSNSSREDLDGQLKKWKAVWISEHAKDRAGVYESAELLGELAYLFLKRAKMEFHARGRHHRRRWVQVTAICFHGIDLCKHIDPVLLRDELRLKCKLHAIYALSLANLSRFFEAHRHLNEAMAILSKTSSTLEDSELAVLRLRRAECDLTEAVQLRDIAEALRQFRESRETNADAPGEDHRLEQGGCWRALAEEFADKLGLSLTARNELPAAGTRQLHPVVQSLLREALDIAPDGGEWTTQEAADEQAVLTELVQKVDQMHAASLDDAWASLESAEKLLAGRSQSSLWWGRLILLKLRVYGTQWGKSQYSTLAYRRRIDHASEVTTLLRRGLLIAVQNPYRTLRFVDYFLDAWREVGCGRPIPPESAQDLMEALQQASRRLRDSLGEFEKEKVEQYAEYFQIGASPETSPDDVHLVVLYFQRIIEKCAKTYPRQKETILREVSRPWSAAAE